MHRFTPSVYFVFACVRHGSCLRCIFWVFHMQQPSAPGSLCKPNREGKENEIGNVTTNGAPLLITQLFVCLFVSYSVRFILGFSGRLFLFFFRLCHFGSSPGSLIQRRATSFSNLHTEQRVAAERHPPLDLSSPAGIPPPTLPTTTTTTTSFISYASLRTVHCKRRDFTSPHLSPLISSVTPRRFSTRRVFPFLTVQSLPAGRVRLSPPLRLADATSQVFLFKLRLPQHGSLLLLVGLRTAICTFKGLKDLEHAQVNQS